MAADEKWYFTKEQLANTPSRKCGIDADKELSYRQQAANFIQDMGQRLSVTQLCINTAIVYMHRFYVFHSLSQFHRNAIATAALFLAAKVEEQPRKLEHVIKVAHVCLHKDQPPPDVRSEQYLEQAQDVVFNENVLLQTLGFDVAIDHPHTHVVRCCHLVRASKDLAQASYFMASNSLHMTTMCLQYKPTVVACFCIHLACKWSNWEIPQSNEGKHWFWYVDRSVTSEMLQQLTSEFLHIFDNCPSRLKRRIKSISAKQSPSLNHPSLPNSPFDTEPRQVSPAADGGPTFQSTRPFPLDEGKKSSGQSSSSATTSATPSSSSRPPVDYREYREKKERERLEREKAGASGVPGGPGLPAEAQNLAKQSSHHSHHAKQQQASTSSSSKHPGVPGAKIVSHHNHHHGTHRNEAKPGAQQQQQQPPSQRHTSSSTSGSSSAVTATGQSGRPSRGPRDYNAGVAANATGYQHGHQTKDATSLGNLAESTPATDLTSLNAPGFDESRVSEKSANHNRSLDPKHEKNQQRGYDPRHKILEHPTKDAEQKTYAKYQQEQQQQQRGRKVIDSMEQRSEEVRKLIEKPLPLPKAPTRSEVSSQKDDYVAYMMKQQAQNAKYAQQQQGQTSEKPGPLLATPSLGNVSRNPPDYGLVTGTTRDKSAMSKSSQLQQSHSNATANAPALKKFDNKSNVKNGNSQPTSDQEGKHEKRSRHLDDERLQGNAIGQQATNVQHGITAQPVKQHKSLFSPEKSTNSRESHTRISSRSSRQKTPPSTGSITSYATGGASSITKSSKVHERVPDQSGNTDHFGAPHETQPTHQSHPNHQNVVQQHQQQQQQQHHHHHHHHHQHHSQTQNPQESAKATSHTKRHRASSIGDTSKQQQQQQQQQAIKVEQQTKMEATKPDPTPRVSEQSIKLEPSTKHETDENRENYESMKMLGRVPELLQPIRDNPTSSNGRGGNAHPATVNAPCSLTNDLKLPELIKPFEPETNVRQTSLTNGLDADFLLLKREETLRDSQDSGFSSGFLSRSSQDYLSPRKSAQSISALLQEPLAPMPSLLQAIDDYEPSQRNSTSQESGAQSSSQRSTYQYNEQRETKRESNVNATYQQSSSSTIEAPSVPSLEKDVLSTVDISALAVPQQTIPEPTSNHRILNLTQPPSNDPSQSVGASNDVLYAQAPTTTGSVATANVTLTGSNSVTTTSATASSTTASTTSSTMSSSATITSRKSGHHKSDKKKKKDKHKHKEKDKEKSRDKKKHKDKEKEKHIKITIPKDKLNLSGETVTSAVPAQSQQSINPNTIENKRSSPTAATGLKIKIPKERLKGNNETTAQSLVQAPLKIKIRTSLGENSESTVSMSGSSSRKRDRTGMDPLLNESVAPPAKKQHPHHHSQGSTNAATTTTTTTTASGTITTTTTAGSTSVNQQQQQHQQPHHHQPQGLTSYVQQQQQQQPGQRPNGRHYSSNNKDKHSSSSSSHHKSLNKLTQQQQQQLLLQHQQQQQQQQLQQLQLQQLQMQLQQQHHQHSHPT